MTWVLLGVQALISSSGLLLLRHSMPVLLDRTHAVPAVTWVSGAGGVLLYGVSFLLWLYILSRNPVSFAYPITIGLTLAITVIGSKVFLGERISAFQILGIAVMAVAIFLLGAGTNYGSAPGDNPG